LAPGDPVAVLIGPDASASPEYIAELRHRLGLDRTLAEQLYLYIVQVAKGDLGFSFFYNEPVLRIVADRLPATLLLMTTGLVAATGIGVLFGVVSAARPRSWLEHGTNLSALLGYSLPVFWLGELALLLFSLRLGWFPSQGMHSLRGESGVGEWIDLGQHLVLPAAVLATRYVAIDYRLVRSGILQTLSQDYIRTARAKGLAPRTILFRHALRNALLPLLTVTGLNVGFAITGAVLTEVVFGWPGIGRLMLDAVGHRDYPVLMGVFAIATAFVVLVNLITDLLYAAVDPRVRLR
jgi:peptide/nickel transport system permease protein